MKLGERPELGHVPDEMTAFAIRPERYGEPMEAFQEEVVATPEIGPQEVLVYVMAAGINYNNVWAALGYPLDVVAQRNKMGEPERFHVGGTDASGIVWQVGEQVSDVAVGDEVVIHGGWWEPEDEWVLAGRDPVLSETTRVWGYQTNYGSFGQFAKAQAHQCLPKPPALSWEEAACFMLSGATAYRMLMGWAPNTVEDGDYVLIWGAAGGLGSMAIQITKHFGGKPIAVVSDESKFQHCLDLGAIAVIDRRNFDHWGPMPPTDSDDYETWVTGARQFGRALWDAAGDKISPRIVFEHPGQATLATSDFVAATGGMVVICAGTSGYNVTMDLRHHWMRQKRFQGSHLCNDEQAAAINELVANGAVDPCLSRTFAFEELPKAHQLMYANEHPPGNMAVLVNALEPELGRS